MFDTFGGVFLALTLQDLVHWSIDWFYDRKETASYRKLQKLYAQQSACNKKPIKKAVAKKPVKKK